MICYSHLCQSVQAAALLPFKSSLSSVCYVPPYSFSPKKTWPSPFVCFFCFSNPRPSRCQTFPCVSSDLACYLFQKITPTDQMATGLPCPSYSSLDPQVPHVQTNTLPLFLIISSRKKKTQKRFRICKQGEHR